MQKHIQHDKDERRHFFRKIYLLLYWKGCVWEVSWRPNKDCNILTPQLFWLSQPVFPVLLSWSTEGLGAQTLLGHGSHSSIFSPTLSPTPTALNFLTPGLYTNLTPTYFLRASQFALNSTLRHSRSPPDIIRQDAPVIYTGAFLILTARPGQRSICNIRIWGTIFISNWPLDCGGCLEYVHCIHYWGLRFSSQKSDTVVTKQKIADNQNGGWKRKWNLYNINKMQYLPMAWTM